MNPLLLTKIKFAIREATAFVGHSFAEDDREIVDQLKEFLSKLGIRCESGKRPEPRPINEKVLERIRAAEFFIGIFTRKDPLPDGKYTTSPWVVEEKAAAITAGKRLLLFVEDGVTEFGGLQGDYEYIRFDRSDFAKSLIHAIDYVLAITTIPLQCRVEGPNRLHFQVGQPTTPEIQIAELRKLKLTEPRNPVVRVQLATLLEHSGDRAVAMEELKQAIREFPAAPDPYHELGHMLERGGQLLDAVLQFQQALDLAPQELKNYRCYGKCLYHRAKELPDKKAKDATLQKAGRLLQQAYSMSPEQTRSQIERELYLVQEALDDFCKCDDVPDAGAA